MAMGRLPEVHQNNIAEVTHEGCKGKGTSGHEQCIFALAKTLVRPVRDWQKAAAAPRPCRTVTFALADKIGKSEAHHLIEAASKRALAEKRHLRQVLSADPQVTAHLAPKKIAALFEPMASQGASQALIDRLLDSLDLS